MIHILDHKTDRVLGDSSKYYDDNHYESIKNQETFNFKEPVNSNISQFLNKKNRVIIPVDDGFFREFIIYESDQFKDGIEVRTIASYIELKNDEPIAPVTLSGETVNTAMDYILKKSDWKRGITDYAGTRTIVFDEYTEPYSALKKLTNVDNFDLELRFRIETKVGRVIGRYVDMIKKQGKWRGKEIVSGKDLIDAKRKENTDQVVTALYGIGPQKEDGTREVVVIKNEEARQVWGRKGDHLWDIYEPQTDDADMTLARLTTLTEMELNKRISAHVNYEVEGVDIENVLGREHEKIRLGDQARIKATEYNPPIYLDSRIIAREGPIRNKSQKKYTLGEFIEYTEEDLKGYIKLLEKQVAKKIGEAQLVGYAEKIIPEQPTAPDPVEHPKWVDTSGDEPVLKLWDVNSEEYVATKGEKGDPGEDGKDGIAYMGENEPENPAENATWFETDNEGKIIAIKKWTDDTWETAQMDADVFSVDQLSAISANLGDVTAGILNSVIINLINNGTFKAVDAVVGTSFLIKDGLFKSSIGRQDAFYGWLDGDRSKYKGLDGNAANSIVRVVHGRTDSNDNFIFEGIASLLVDDLNVEGKVKSGSALNFEVGGVDAATMHPNKDMVAHGNMAVVGEYISANKIRFRQSAIGSSQDGDLWYGNAFNGLGWYGRKPDGWVKVIDS